MSKKSDLLGAFSEQLSKGTPNTPKAKKAPQKKKPVSKPKQAPERAKQSPVSFYQIDRNIIKEIQNIVEESTGDRINLSSAVRIALRSVNINREKLVDTYNKSKQSDGRRK